MGVDTHGEVHVACAIDQLGRRLAIANFATTPTGDRALLQWAHRFGEVEAFGVEGCGWDGAGLARFLGAQGDLVLEVNRPDRSARRRRGKSDPVRCRSWRLERCWPARSPPPQDRQPPGGDGAVPAGGSDHREQRPAARPSTPSGPWWSPPRLSSTSSCGSYPLTKLAATAAQLECGPILTTTAATELALRLLGERCAALDAELARGDAELDRLTAQAAPQLRQLGGVGPEIAGALLVAAGDNPERLHSEAAFSMLCGASPIPASSGKTVRHRLNRGGNRQANTALYRIVVVRLPWHQPTRDDLARRTNEGLSKREIIRCLQRYVAREVFAALHPPTVLANTA